MPVQYKDYYKILGVPKDASAEQIRKAYRKLARELHPDVNKSSGAEQRFKEVNEANEVLSDPEKRKRYDQLGANWQQYEQWQQQGSGRNFEWVFTGPGGFQYGNGGEDLGDLGGFSDFFRTFFGDLGGAGTATRGGTTRRGARARSGQDFETTVEVSLPEAYRGTERSIEVQEPNGASRRLTVKVPAGVRDRQRIRLAGAGGKGMSGGAAGDLYLVVRVREHPFFKRDGDDVRIELPVTLAEALLGAEVLVPTLKGRVTLRIPPETQNGRVIRLAGQGLPRLGGSGHGDMYVTVKVTLPTKLSDEEKAGIRKIAEKHADDVRSHLL
jgi:DnaJ-class molecular chaperone